MSSRVINADCREAMAAMLADSIDAIVTDPPYGLSFRGRDWDHGIPGVHFWAEALRVAKPGAHLLAFGGTRTYHRLACAIEDAGWEIRDCVMWLYGSGFPKSLDVSKAIDARALTGKTNSAALKAANKLRPDGGENQYSSRRGASGSDFGRIAAIAQGYKTEATDAYHGQDRWAGWGTALKPAFEPVIVARKPLRGTVAANVMQHGTGALNIDGCRVAADDKTPAPVGQFVGSSIGPNGHSGIRDGAADSLGRWPANVIHDGSDEVVALFPESGNGSGEPTITTRRRDAGWCNSSPGEGVAAIDNFGDTGSAARFFYTAKASKADRDDGLYHRALKPAGVMDDDAYVWAKNGDGSERAKKVAPRGNHHPTVKPVELMRYLCRLVTPPGGTVLDPFCGSGSTGKAALLEGFDFIGIELDPEYAAIAADRIYATAPLFAGAAD